ncbi:hypothetical protein MKX01_007474 [Papaver californicum]|nr:hypothetical protein MKX01_007474 [Papaver californicum]
MSGAGKKRKSDASRLDEVDRTMYTSFCNAANSLSQLYTQAMNQQKLSFQAGERHAQEKLYQWIVRQHEEGSRVMTPDILNYLQNELDYGAEEPHPMSPRLQTQQHYQQPPTNISMNSSGHVSSGSCGPGVGPRLANSDNQVKNSVFSNALSSPVRRNLQHYQLSEGAFHPNSLSMLASGNLNRNNNDNIFIHHQSRDSNSPTFSDSTMDMHSDSPDRNPVY